MFCKDFLVLDRQENEILRSIFEIFYRIFDLKRMLYFSDLILVDVYVFRNFKFRKLLLIQIMKLLLCFFVKEIDMEEFVYCFGILFVLFIVVEEYGYVVLNYLEESLLVMFEELEVIVKIDFGFGNGLYNVVVQNDEEIWISGWDKILKFYNLNGELIKFV